MCRGATEIQIPPQTVIDVINSLLITVIDPDVCPILVTLHNTGLGGVPGVVTIAQDGDISVALVGLVYDCPPYADGSGAPIPDDATYVELPPL